MFSVNDALWNFLYATVAGEDRPIAATSAARLPGERLTTYHNKNIGRQKRGKKLTVDRKETEDYEILKKPWMIPLQHLILTMITSV